MSWLTRSGASACTQWLASAIRSTRTFGTQARSGSASSPTQGAVLVPPHDQGRGVHATQAVHLRQRVGPEGGPVIDGSAHGARPGRLLAQGRRSA